MEHYKYSLSLWEFVPENLIYFTSEWLSMWWYNMFEGKHNKSFCIRTVWAAGCHAVLTQCNWQGLSSHCAMVFRLELMVPFTTNSSCFPCSVLDYQSARHSYHFCLLPYHCIKASLHTLYCVEFVSDIGPWLWTPRISDFSLLVLCLKPSVT